MKFRLQILLLVVASYCGTAVADDAVDPDPRRYAAEIEAFAAWDRMNAAPDNAVLFVGSSSIRLWATAEAFPGLPVINRGFGGSEMSDVVYFFDRIVRPYAPAVIVVYAGDNDITNGKRAAQVFEDWREFVARVEAALPGTKLLFISIKPSPARWSHWPEMQAANRLVRKYAETRADIRFADLAAPLLGNDGRPKDVYVADGIHLDEAGYALWREALAPFIE